MARIRTVKPELFRHEDLFNLEAETSLPIRLSFIGLFTCCDREGKFQWRPKVLKLDILPYDDVDFSRVLDALWSRGFIVKYKVENEFYGQITTFTRHQLINNREMKSVLPTPSKETIIDASNTRQARYTETLEGKGREGKGIGREEESTLDDKSSKGADAPVNDLFVDGNCSTKPNGLNQPENPDSSPPTVWADPHDAMFHSHEGKPEWWPKRDRYGRVWNTEITDKLVFQVGKIIGGTSFGGQITKIKQAYKFDLTKTLEILLEAEDKENPREWLAALLKKIRIGDEIPYPKSEKFPLSEYWERRPEDGIKN